MGLGKVYNVPETEPRSSIAIGRTLFMPSSGSELGTQKVFYAIKSRHPELTDEQVHQMVDVVLDQVAKRIGSGDALAFFRLDEDDKAEVITYSLEPRTRKTK
jgi:hypothetical protein